MKVGRVSCRSATRARRSVRRKGSRNVPPVTSLFSHSAKQTLYRASAGSTSPKAPFAPFRQGRVTNLGAGEVTVLDLEDTEGPMRLAPFVGG